MLRFSLTEQQEKEIRKWREEHDCSLRTDDRGVKGEIYVGAIGGAITYQFTPTGLGICEGVKCACNQTLDLTDYDEW